MTRKKLPVKFPNFSCFNLFILRGEHYVFTFCSCTFFIRRKWTEGSKQPKRKSNKKPDVCEQSQMQSYDRRGIKNNEFNI